MPISVRRVKTLGASLVCNVVSTRWPVRAASIAICAVSWSRISPIRMMSGSERKIDRRAAAKVKPALGFTCTWLMPGIRYSTGSSTVTMLTSGRTTAFNVAYKLVDLPEPVGPLTISMP